MDENKENAKVKLTVYGAPLELGDTIKATGVFSEIKGSTVGFDEKSYNLSKGILYELESQSYEKIGKEPMIVKKSLMSVNRFLDKRLSLSKSEDNYKMLSALFLGNKSALDKETQRDFTRIGLSHVLALSGMHITIIVTLLGFLLKLLRLPLRVKELILILATIFFVAITGFSDSALRSGIMVSLVYVLCMLGTRLNIITALFLSVTIICVFDPYSIFSISLLLSLFAMLGCIISSKLAHRVGFLRKIRLKIVRYPIFTLITSLFAIAFTLAIIFTVYGSITVLSVLTNIFISPLFSLLIYITPIYMLTASIPFLGAGVDWVTTKITELTLLLGKWCASLDGIVVPIVSYVQIIGVALIVLSILALLLVRRRLTIHTLCITLCGIIVFIVGTVIWSNHKSNNIYVSVYAENGNDVVFIEDCGTLTVVDITKGTNNAVSIATGGANHLGYYEIDSYILTDYSSKSLSSVTALLDGVVVKSIALPSPASEEEIELSQSIEMLALERGVKLFYNDGTIETKSAKITFAKEDTLGRSSLRSVAFTVEASDKTVAYLGASAYELCDYFIEDSVHKADCVIFGSYGPKYKVEYEYSAPYLDSCVFLGDSKGFAKSTFLDLVDDKAAPVEGYPVRFKLTT